MLGKSVTIKRQTFGIGKPLICVPVVEIKEDEIYRAAELCVQRGAEVLEWRMDWFSDVFEWEKTGQVLHNLQEICRDVILLCTFRSKPQGGERDISQEEYSELLQKTAQSKRADLLDVEVSQLSDSASLIQTLHDYGQYVIGSHHCFSHTPETEQMKQDLGKMKQAGADIGKLAVMPHSSSDVLRLLDVTTQMKEENPDYPLITMAMGGLGVISRLGGQVFGSCMTFASVEKTSAPGQLPLEDVTLILDKIAESMEQENGKE